jgi:hypothetical protein
MIIKQNININTNLENSLQKKLQFLPVQDWKNTIIDGTMDENADLDTLQQVLDVVSPIKSPQKSTETWEDVNLQGYAVSGKILGEGQNKVRVGTHLKTNRIVYLNN